MKKNIFGVLAVLCWLFGAFLAFGFFNMDAGANTPIFNAVSFVIIVGVSIVVGFLFFWLYLKNKKMDEHTLDVANKVQGKKRFSIYFISISTSLVLICGLSGVFAYRNIPINETPVISEEKMNILLTGDNLLAVIASDSKKSVDEVYDSFTNHTMSNDLLCDLSIKTSELHDSYQDSLDGINTDEHPEFEEYKAFVASYVVLNNAVNLDICLYIQSGDAEYLDNIIKDRNAAQECYDFAIQSREKFLSNLGFSEDEIDNMINDMSE